MEIIEMFFVCWYQPNHPYFRGNPFFVQPLNKSQIKTRHRYTFRFRDIYAPLFNFSGSLNFVISLNDPYADVMQIYGALWVLGQKDYDLHVLREPQLRVWRIRIKWKVGTLQHGQLVVIVVPQRLDPGIHHEIRIYQVVAPLTTGKDAFICNSYVCCLFL